MPRRARDLELSPTQRRLLEAISRSRTLPQRLVERAQIVVWCADGHSDAAQARLLGVDAQRPRRWRKRWLSQVEDLAAAERAGASERELSQRIQGMLLDDERPGSPRKFSPEQVAQIISLACERPEESGLAVTHWTPNELAKEARKRGVVESISPRHLDRLMKSVRASPP
jgi:putative transposase